MASLRFASVQLTTGPTLHYAEQGDASGEQILFLHGWPDSWFSFSRVLAALPQSCHAFAIDQRGFGDSERPLGLYSIDQFAEDAVAFMDAQGLERATIVGHSFGSFVTRRIAIAHPQRMARMVLIGSAVSAANTVTRTVQTAMLTLNDPVSVDFARDFQASTAYAPLPDEFFNRIVAESMKLPARLWRQVFDAVLAYDDTAVLGRIIAPTLLLWGERDALFPRQDQDYLAAGIRHATLSVYSETGHCPNWERPERVASDIQEFLSQASHSIP